MDPPSISPLSVEKRTFLDACSGGHMDAVLWYALCRHLDPFEQEGDRERSDSSDSSRGERARVGLVVGGGGRGENAVIAAAKAGHADVVFVLLMRFCEAAYMHTHYSYSRAPASASAAPASKSDSPTIPPWTIHSQSWRELGKVLEPGLRLKDTSGRTAIDWACAFGHTRVIAFLIDICPSIMRSWQQRQLFATRDENSTLHVETAAYFMRKQQQQQQQQLVSVSNTAGTGVPNRASSIGSAFLAAPIASTIIAAANQPPKFSLHSILHNSGNRWLSSRVPYLTFASFVCSALLTMRYIFTSLVQKHGATSKMEELSTNVGVTVTVTARNLLALVSQIITFVLLFFVRKIDPGCVVPALQPKAAAAAAVVPSEGNQSSQITDTIADPDAGIGTDRYRYRQSLGNFYAISTRRAKQLKRQLYSQKGSDVADSTANAYLGMSTVADSCSEDVWNIIASSKRKAKMIESRSLFCYICQCSREEQLPLPDDPQLQAHLQSPDEKGKVCGSGRRAKPTMCAEYIGHSEMSHCCIRGYDHHCVYLGIDVGSQNYRVYLGALSWLVLCAFPAFIAATAEYLRGGVSVPLLLSGLEATAAPSVNIDDRSHARGLAESAPLYIRAFLVWTLLIWFQMGCLFAVHIYCTFWLRCTTKAFFRSFSSDGKSLKGAGKRKEQ